MMTGVPVWAQLLGASGAGKTALLKSLQALERVELVSDFSGPAALLSGTKKKEVAKDATGGVLHKLGNNGCLVFPEFSSVLSKSPEAKNEILGIFRGLFDRTWKRDIGGEGGRTLAHTGRVCLVAACTHAIDRAVDVNREMGERCLYFRFRDTDGYQESMCALDDTNPEETERALRKLVEDMFWDLDLSFVRPTPRPTLPRVVNDRIARIAQLGAKCRSSVPRDHTHQIIDKPAPEVGTRMSKQLAQLYCGMELIGNTPAERWTMMRKVALDSMPLSRRSVLEVVTNQPGVRATEIKDRAGIGGPLTGRILEDLNLLEIIQRKGEGWELREWTRERLRETE